MAKKSKLEEVQSTFVEAAKTGADNLRVVAGEALGAAAAAAAGVVMDHVAQALASGEKSVSDATPATPATQGIMQETIVSAVGPAKKKRAAVKRKLVLKKKTAPKKVAKKAVKKAGKKTAKKKLKSKTGRR